MTTDLQVTLSTQRVLQPWQTYVLKLSRSGGKLLSQGYSPEEALLEIASLESGNVENLWTLYTQDRPGIKKKLLTEKPQILAYLLGFHLPNVARMKGLLQRLDQRYNFFSAVKEYQIFDLGSGTGAMTIALLDALQQPSHLQVTLCDSSKGALGVAEDLLANTYPSLKIHKVVSSIEEFSTLRNRLKPGSKKIFLFGYILNELLKNQKAQKYLFNLWMYLVAHENAVLLFVEPAQEALSLAMMSLRDSLTKLGLTPLYPCSHSAPCPMLQSTAGLVKDWCFSEIPWQQNHFLKQIDQILNRKNTTLRGTLLAFGTKSAIQNLSIPADKPVVVGRPSLHKGRASKDLTGWNYLLCEEGSLHKQPPKKAEVEQRLRGSFYTNKEAL